MYFFDLGDNTLYVQPPGAHAPAKAPSGGMGVLAAVFSCGSCDDRDSRFIGYLVMQSPQYTQAIMDGTLITPELATAGTLFREVEGGNWFTRESEVGRTLIESVQQRCPEGKLRACSP